MENLKLKPEDLGPDFGKNEHKESELKSQETSKEIEYGKKRLKFTVRRPHFSPSDNLNGHYDTVIMRKHIKDSNSFEEDKEVKLELEDGGDEELEVDLDVGDVLIIERWYGTQKEGVVYFSNGSFPFIRIDSWEDSYADDDENTEQEEGNYPTFKKINQSFYTKKDSVKAAGIEIV